MKLKYVTIERDGPVAIVKFDRKKNKNAFNQGLILELTKVARRYKRKCLDTHWLEIIG